MREIERAIVSAINYGGLFCRQGYYRIIVLSKENYEQWKSQYNIKSLVSSVGLTEIGFKNSRVSTLDGCDFYVGYWEVC